MGGGMLVRQEPAPGAPGGTLFLVTDIGMRYPLQDEQSVSALGYDAPSAVAIPGPLLDLLPSGPVLGTTAALRSVAPTS